MEVIVHTMVDSTPLRVLIQPPATAPIYSVPQVPTEHKLGRIKTQIIWVDSIICVLSGN
jgi:hypothetical protein